MVQDQDQKRLKLEAYKRRRVREQKNRAYGITVLLLILAVITIFMILRVMGRQRPEARYMFLTEEWLSKEVEADALIIRDETVYKSPIEGIFRSFVPQGSKVAKKADLGEILPKDKIAELRQIEKANNDVNDRRYELIEQGKGGDARRIFEAGNEAVRRNLGILYDYLILNDNSKTAEIESELRLTMEQRVEDIRSFEFEDPELERLTAYRDTLENAASGSKQTIVSEASGVFIRYVDGLESELNKETALSMTPEQLEKYLGKARSGSTMIEEVKAGDPLYKLSRDINQYFVMLIPRGYVSSSDEHTALRVYSPLNGVELNDAYIVRVEETRQGSLLVFRSNRALESFCAMRRAPLKLYLKENKGLRVPKSALIGYKEGNLEAEVKLVYGGYVHTCPVKISETNTYYALIQPVDNTPYPIEVSTMILLNPESMEEGDPIAEAY